jgi:hypothetical protein
MCPCVRWPNQPQHNRPIWTKKYLPSSTNKTTPRLTRSTAKWRICSLTASPHLDPKRGHEATGNHAATPIWNLDPYGALRRAWVPWIAWDLVIHAESCGADVPPHHTPRCHGFIARQNLATVALLWTGWNFRRRCTTGQQFLLNILHPDHEQGWPT